MSLDSWHFFNIWYACVTMIILVPQSMEEQLRHREEKIAELEAELAEVRRKGQREKEMLKKATKQHRNQAAQSEHTVETLAAQIEDMVSTSVEISTNDAFV